MPLFIDCSLSPNSVVPAAMFSSLHGKFISFNKLWKLLAHPSDKSVLYLIKIQILVPSSTFLLLLVFEQNLKINHQIWGQIKYPWR